MSKVSAPVQPGHAALLMIVGNTGLLVAAFGAAAVKKLPPAREGGYLGRGV